MKRLVKKMGQSCWRYIVLVGVVCLALLLTWICPIQSDSVTVSLLTDGSCEGQVVDVNIYTEAAYKDLYVCHATVSQGTLDVLLPAEYLPVDQFFVTDENFVRSVIGLSILSNGFHVADYQSAETTEDIFASKNDAFYFNECAFETIEAGRSNPWFMRVVVSVAVVLVAVAWMVYFLLKKYFGGFKTTLAYGIGGTALWLLASWKQDKLFSITLNLAGKSVSNGMFVAAVVCVFSLLLIVCVLCDQKHKISKWLIPIVYIAVLLFSVGKMMFYAEKVANTPDEPSHIAYITYLEATGEWIPRYENMPMAHVISSDTEMMTIRFAEGSVNNLRHPPLYYHLMRLSNSMTFHENGTITVDLDRIRGCSMLFATMAIALVMYIGYSRLKKTPLLHLLYATIVTSIPMMTYGMSGINNDSFTVLTVAVFFLGLLRFAERKRNFPTYLLIAIGITATLLTKMTAGIIVVVAAVVVIVVALVREKCWNQLFSWQFLITLPVYVLAAAYYLYVYAQYGAFQPSLHALNEAYAYSTGFYLPVENRSVQSMLEYIAYYFDRFVQSWWGIASHIALMKPEHYAFLETATLSMLWLFPLLLCFKSVRRGMTHTTNIAAMYIGVSVTAVMQFVNGYVGLLDRGYLGGFQSRYYLCAIPMFALSATLLLQKAFVKTDSRNCYTIVVRRIAMCAAVVFIGMMVYSDFVYFLLHYTNYLK